MRMPIRLFRPVPPIFLNGQFLLLAFFAFLTSACSHTTRIEIRQSEKCLAGEKDASKYLKQFKEGSIELRKAYDYGARIRPELERRFNDGMSAGIKKLKEQDMELNPAALPAQSTFGTEVTIKADGSIAKWTPDCKFGVEELDNSILRELENVRKLAPPPAVLLDQNKVLRIHWEFIFKNDAT